jgi:hypothetical protein
MYNPPHPGETLKEDVLPALGLTVTQAAEELGVIGGNHLVTGLGQFLTDGGTQTTHGTGNESDTLRHNYSFLVDKSGVKKAYGQYMC